MSTTNQTQTSKDKSIIQGIGFKEFTAICEEYQIVQTATKELLSIANNPNTSERVRVDIYKWVVEMNIGKPKQMNDILLDTKENELKITRTIVSFTDTKEEIDTLKELKEELLQMGCSQQQIDERIEQNSKEIEV